MNDFYHRYIRSREWAARRLQKLKEIGWHCELCTNTSEDRTLQVHHLTYANLGNEPMEDLQVVCIDCHPFADCIRRAKAGRERHKKLWPRLARNNEWLQWIEEFSNSRAVIHTAQDEENWAIRKELALIGFDNLAWDGRFP